MDFLERFYCCQKEGAQKRCQPSQEKVEVEAGGGEEGYDAVAVTALEIVALHAVVSMTHGIYREVAPQNSPVWRAGDQLHS
jgi:hypothetical protein